MKKQINKNTAATAAKATKVKARYTHAVYYRTDGTTRIVKFQLPEEKMKAAAKAAKAKKATRRTVAA